MAQTPRGVLMVILSLIITSSALETSTSLDSSPLYGPDDFVAEESMDGDAVYQEITLPEENETKVEKRVNGEEHSVSGRFHDDTQVIRLADDASSYREAHEGNKSKRNSEVPAVLLIAISALALTTALAITVVSLLYHRRRRAESSQNPDPRSSLYNIENEPRAWDSLSFSQSITDLSNNKVNSWESLSDDSYINSLDEAISQKASIIHKKSRIAARSKSTNTKNNANNSSDTPKLSETSIK